MNNHLKLTGAILTTCLSLTIIGCGTPALQSTTLDKITKASQNTTHIVSNALAMSEAVLTIAPELAIQSERLDQVAQSLNTASNTLNVIRGTAQVLAPINPYQPAMEVVFAGASGVIALLAGWVARRRGIELERQYDAADSLAETVVRNGLQPHAFATAGSNGVIDVVARHMDNNISPPPQPNRSPVE